MTRRQPDFKPTQVFDWASEPADERPTGFGHSTDFARSTGYSSLSGFAALESTNSMRARRRHRTGVMKLALTGIFIIGLSTSALIAMGHYLRG